jgi:hypothetical protein
MPGARALLVTALLSLSAASLAHHAPNSFVRLDFRAASVRAEMMIPRSELAWAMEGAPSEAALPDYLLRHVGATSPEGDAWTVEVSAVRATTYLGQPYFTALVEFVPPAGASTRDFVLTHDAITHEVRNHVVVVVAEHDHADAKAAPRMIGALQYPARTLAVHR